MNKQEYMKNYNQEHYREQRIWRKQHPQNVQEARERFKTKHPFYFLKKRREYKKQIDAYNRNYNFKNKEKLNAERQTLNEPLFDRCEICESSLNLMHHHPDYSEPSIYVTLCASCHAYVHKSIGVKT